MNGASLFVGFYVFCVALTLGGIAWFALGMLTGIYGMCSTASEWWSGTYLMLGASVVFLSVCIGVYAAEKEAARLK